MSLGRIGWVGLGHMGVPMARNVLKAGFRLRVFNRNPARLAEVPAPTAESPLALAQEADVVMTMLGDDAALEAVVFGPSGLVHGFRKGMILVNMGTHSPEISRATAERLAPLGVQVLDAPVSGSVKPATDGTLVILVGGEQKTYERVRPLFDVLGKRSFYFGAHGQGACAKLAINMMLGLTLQALAEAVTLGERAGLDRDTLLDMISETACASPIVNMKLPSIRAGEYPAAFPLKHMEKDFRLATDLSRQVGAAVPTTVAAAETFTQAKANGLGDFDIMGILLQLQALSAQAPKLAAGE